MTIYAGPGKPFNQRPSTPPGSSRTNNTEPYHYKTYKERNAGRGKAPRTPKTKTPLLKSGIPSAIGVISIKTLFAIAVLVFALFIIATSLPPWRMVALFLVEDSSISIMSLLRYIPLVGGFLASLFTTGGGVLSDGTQAFGVLLMIAVNICQMTLLVKELMSLYIAPKKLQTLKRIAIAGWIIEFIVATLYNFPYKGGVDTYLSHAPNLVRSSSFLPQEVVSIVVLMFQAEVSLWVFVAIGGFLGTVLSKWENNVSRSA